MAGWDTSCHVAGFRSSTTMGWLIGGDGVSHTPPPLLSDVWHRMNFGHRRAGDHLSIRRQLKLGPCSHTGCTLSAGWGADSDREFDFRVLPHLPTSTSTAETLWLLRTKTRRSAARANRNARSTSSVDSGMRTVGLPRNSACASCVDVIRPLKDISSLRAAVKFIAGKMLLFC